MESIVIEYLHRIGIRVSKRYFESLIGVHPEYSSPLSIIDTLRRLGIKCALQDVKKKHLYTLKFPYILCLDCDEIKFLLIRDKKDLDKHRIDSLNCRCGVISTSSKGKVLDKKNNTELKVEKAKKSASMLLLSILGVFFVLSVFKLPWLLAILMCTSLTGLIVGYLLVGREVGIKFRSVERFCNFGSRMSCEAVSNYSNWKFLGALSPSDLTLAYFGFQLITISSLVIIPSEAQSVLWGLTTLSIFSIFIAFYSLYLQYFKIQAWCKLCLIVDFLLFLQACLLVPIHFLEGLNPLSVSFVTIAAFTLLLISITSLEVITKNLLSENASYRRAMFDSGRVKYDLGVFTALMNKSRRVSCHRFDNELVIGNSDALINITVVSDLFCDPCKTNHGELSELIRIYSEYVSVTVRFFPNDVDDDQPINANEYLLQYWNDFIKDKPDSLQRSDQLIHDWYALRDFEKFKSQYPLSKNVSFAAGKKLFAEHVKWTSDVAIDGTPTIFVEGFQMPDQYTVTDLMILIPYFIRQTLSTLPKT